MPQVPVDLTNCDREPIHIPGAIQPHGVLVVCRAGDHVVTHVSENLPQVVGLAVDDVVGRPVEEIFLPDEAAERGAMLASQLSETRPVYLFTLQVRGTSRRFDAIAHQHSGVIFLEFEPTAESRELSAPELYRLVQEGIADFNRTTTTHDLYNAASQHVRALSGFDRVMVYRFDDEWNGQVVAESKQEGLEPFLGLHYPASDIPQQARRLYEKNWLRFITDRDYVPARIVPESGPDTGEPLDLSYSVLRSVSPIHLEYLRNMGVAASMSISLVRDGALWGLIACHHQTPRFVPYDVRTACELLGQFMSLSMSAAEDRERASQRQAMRDVAAGIIANVEQCEDATTALVDLEPCLLDFVDAEGAAVVVGDEVARIGQTPGEVEIRELSHWIAANRPGDIFATDHLREHYGSGLLGSVASGVLLISLGATRPHHLLWFRTEQVRTVEWAGDPAKSVVKGNEEVRLSPRGSFALWKQTVQGRSRPWTLTELEGAGYLRDALTRQLLRRAEQVAIAHTDLQQAGAKREELLTSERAARVESERMHRIKDEFVAMLSHELRTPLNAILGWAQLLAMGEGLTEELEEGLGIIERSARSQAHMIEDLLDVSRIISGKLSLSFVETHLPSIVEEAIGTIHLAAEAKGIRIEKVIDPLIGVETTGDPSRLQQVVWNLLSNAVKFTPRGGKIQVVLERVESHVELSVSDTGQGIPPEFLPHVFDRFRQADGSASRDHGGLGLGLSIVRHLIEMHGGTVRAQSAGAGQGATFVVSLPVRAIRREETTGGSPNASQYDKIDLTGISVLALDDEPDARKLVHRILEGCGCSVQSAASIDEALALIHSQPFDVMLSDIGMPGGDGYEFIRQVRAAEVELGRPKAPAIALTAYARAEDRRKVLMAGYQAHISKPVESGELVAVIASLIGRV